MLLPRTCFCHHKLRHYFLAHPSTWSLDRILWSISCQDQLGSGRTTRCLLQLDEFSITVCHSRWLRSQALFDLLAQFPLESVSPYMKTCNVRRFALWKLQNGTWPLMVCPLIEAVGKIVLYDHDGINVSLSFKLEFPWSNNEAECKALILGIVTAVHIEVRRPRVQGDSGLIIQQLNGEFAFEGGCPCWLSNCCKEAH